MSLYLESGYLDQEWIKRVALSNGCYFIVEIGGRQVGKTYGVMELVLKSDDQFMLMRRTQTEADYICSGINSPFAEHAENITTKKQGRYIGIIRRDDEQIGMIAGLSSMAKIRGFSMRQIKTVIYDEFIPERHTQRIRDEGDAFINAMITISGNRELEGEKPPLVWLLANPNVYSNPICTTLGIVDKLGAMEVRGQEYAILPDKGIMLVRPSSEEIMSRRRKNAIFRAIAEDSTVSQMALDNKFAYDDQTGVGHQNIREYLACACIAGRLTIWLHKSEDRYYITNYMSEVGAVYYDNAADRERFRTLWSSVIRNAYKNNRIIFSTLRIKDYLFSLINGEV